MKTVDLKIENLSSNDVSRITQTLREVPGVLSVIVDLADNRTRVEGQNLELAVLQAALSKEGYQAQRQDSLNDAEERLYVDGGNLELSNNFWCHMGRYLHARTVAAMQRSEKGEPLRILDAASGTGYGAYLLSQAGDLCDGVDLSGQAIDFSRKTYGRKNCCFTEASVLELPFEDASFDLGVSFETIEHLPRQQQAAFVRELRRVLKPHSQLVLSAPVSNGGAENPNHNHHHAYEPDAAELVEMVEEIFRGVQVRGQLVAPLSASEVPIPATSMISATGENSGKQKSSPAKLARELARGAANQLFKSSYLEKPATLQTVMNALYAGYLVKPLDLQSQRATFVVLQARS